MSVDEVGVEGSTAYSETASGHIRAVHDLIRCSDNSERGGKFEGTLVAIFASGRILLVTPSWSGRCSSSTEGGSSKGGELHLDGSSS